MRYILSLYRGYRLHFLLSPLTFKVISPKPRGKTTSLHGGKRQCYLFRIFFSSSGGKKCIFYPYYILVNYSGQWIMERSQVCHFQPGPWNTPNDLLRALDPRCSNYIMKKAAVLRFLNKHLENRCLRGPPKSTSKCDLNKTKQKKHFLIVWMGMFLLWYFKFLYPYRTRERERALCSLHQPYHRNSCRTKKQGKDCSSICWSVICLPLPWLIRQSVAPPRVRVPFCLWWIKWDKE